MNMSSGTTYIFSLMFALIRCHFEESTSPDEDRYNYQLNMGEWGIYCPLADNECSDGQDHFLCDREKPCRSYKVVKLTTMKRNRFLYGHNGIRNKVAYNWNIANMNILHWSRELETLAQIYLEQCTFKRDPCLTIGTNALVVNQNTFTLKTLTKRWSGRVIRSWYRELGMHVRTFDQFFRNQQKGRMLNFTQMIWPNVEFIGCAAASFSRMKYIVCYYWPSFHSNNTRAIFRFGNPCTKCFRNRNVCSHNFMGLCGMDLDVADSGQASFSTLFILWFCVLWNVVLHANK